jgi:phage tail-like protein
MPISQEKQHRAFIAGRFELELNREPCGLLYSIDGGNFKSEAIGEKVGGDGLVTRYPGRQKFDEITFTIGPAMAPQFWKWIKDSLHNNPSRRHGEIVALDYDHNERSRRAFYDALVSEIQFPALDAKSKEGKRITIKIAPERVVYAPEIRPRGQPVAIDYRVQKEALPANFAFRLDGIDKEITRRVSKIEAFSVKQNIIENPVGGLLFVKKEAGRVEFPTISFMIPESHVKPFMKWWEEFVGEGNHVHSKERNGSIEYLDSTMRKVIGTISLQGVGITGVTFDKHEGHSEQVRQAKVDLYVESLDFNFDKH